MKTPNHTTTSKALLWAAVEKWSVAKWGKVNLSKLATESGIGLGTAARLKDLEVTVGLDKIQAIADVFGVPVWQFLDPSCDPKSPTPPKSPEAVSLANSLDQIADPVARRRAYTLAAQVIDFAQIPAGYAPSVP